jgi:hypothetical protein
VSDEVTNAELARGLDRVHKDLSEISRRLDQYVLQAVYTAEMRDRDRRLDALERDIQAVEDQRRALFRWVVGAVVVPAVVLLVQIVLAVRGPT